MNLQSLVTLMIWMDHRLWEWGQERDQWAQEAPLLSNHLAPSVPQLLPVHPDSQHNILPNLRWRSTGNWVTPDQPRRSASAESGRWVPLLWQEWFISLSPAWPKGSGSPVSLEIRVSRTPIPNTSPKTCFQVSSSVCWEGGVLPLVALLYSGADAN